MSDTMIANSEPYTIWGAARSAFTAKVRSYMIKKGIPYRELLPSNPYYMERVLPAMGVFVIPVLEHPKGVFIQDSADIIRFLDERHPVPCFNPATPIQEVVAKLISSFGSEGMVQAWMHYTWSFVDKQDYVITEFSRAISTAQDKKQRRADAMSSVELMRSHLPELGITAQSVPAI